ncbi:hypothetical protein [Streptomyces pratensis]|uniref:hypothetical protein n=1 Tax=Streptomyces pratensis TaxID=1169025 RepID=UPI003015A428
MTPEPPPAAPTRDDDGPGAPFALARLAGREAHCLALTTRAQPPPVTVVPEPCPGCGAGRAAALEHARAMPFGRVAVAGRTNGPVDAPVTLSVLACERLNASVLIAVTHLHEHGGEEPLWLRSRSATALDRALRRTPSRSALLEYVDAEEAWYDHFMTGAPAGRPTAADGPHTLPVQFDAFAGPERPPAGRRGVAAVIRAAREPFLLPHSPHRPSQADADAYERLRATALWERLRDLNRAVPPGPRVPPPDDYSLLSHPPGGPEGVVPLP